MMAFAVSKRQGLRLHAFSWAKDDPKVPGRITRAQRCNPNVSSRRGASIVVASSVNWNWFQIARHDWTNFPGAPVEKHHRLLAIAARCGWVCVSVVPGKRLMRDFGGEKAPLRSD